MKNNTTILNKSVLRQAGLSKVYKYIVLPPEHRHTTVTSLCVEERKFMEDIVKMVKKNSHDYLIKYRDQNQLLAFPTFDASEVGYGHLMKYCNKNTIVIGHPGSAMIECLRNNIRFFSYFDYERICHKSSINLLLLKCLYIAKNKEELSDNILTNKIFKPGYTKEDLLFNDGKYLHEIVSSIFNIKA